MFFAIGLSSCQPEPTFPDQNKIYTVYTLNYNYSLNKTSAEVNFYLDEAGTTNQQKLELTYPAQVDYNGDDLVFSADDRGYHKEFVGLIENTFLYSNYHGSLYSNQITMVDSVVMTTSSDSAATQQDYYFSVQGSALSSDEIIDIYVESLSNGVMLGYTFTSLSGLNIQISSSQLSSLGNGPTLLRATRKSSNAPNLQSPSVGGDIYTEYSVQDTIIIY
jgi:hypothetical protein